MLMVWFLWSLKSSYSGCIKDFMFLLILRALEILKLVSQLLD